MSTPDAVVWRYVAIDRQRQTQRGVLPGGSGAEVRSALRRQGLTPVRVRAARPVTARMGLLRRPIERWLRSRRHRQLGRLFESLATLLGAGVPIAEALGTIGGGGAEPGSRKRGGLRGVAMTLKFEVESGRSVSDAMGAHPSWFGGFELAMVEAGQERGELASVLSELADRKRLDGELSAQLVGALAYPLLVAAVALVVVVVLSTKALPELTGVLQSAGVEPPRLTRVVMRIGQVLAGYGTIVLALGVVAVVAVAVLLAFVRTRGIYLPDRVIVRLPEVIRRLRTAAVSTQLAEMVCCGVRLPRALRIAAETQRGLIAGGLGECLGRAADRIDEGEPLSGVLERSAWFSPEHTKLIVIGEASGELGDVLARLGASENRAARRAVERLTAALQPAAILLLAALIGIVVMSAIQPIVKLREILG